jgi:ornithine--oxo-acid transaminase
MRAGLATRAVLETERLGERALAEGEVLRRRLREALAGYEMVADVRGLGMLSGIEFKAPRKLALRAAYESFMAIHPGMFGQIVVMRLFRDHDVLAQICGNNFLVLKVAPPLMVSERQMDHFVAAMRAVVELMHGAPAFWTEALGLARRVANI